MAPRRPAQATQTPPTPASPNPVTNFTHGALLRTTLSKPSGSPLASQAPLSLNFAQLPAGPDALQLRLLLSASAPPWRPALPFQAELRLPSPATDWLLLTRVLSRSGAQCLQQPGRRLSSLPFSRWERGRTNELRKGCLSFCPSVPPSLPQRQATCFIVSSKKQPAQYLSSASQALAATGGLSPRALTSPE